MSHQNERPHSNGVPPEEDDSDFVLVVNRKKSHVPERKGRQSHEDSSDQQSQNSYQGRRRKYRDKDRGGTEQKPFRRKDKNADKENIHKTAPPHIPPQSPQPPQNPPQQISAPPPVRTFSLVVAGRLPAPPQPPPPPAQTQKGTQTDPEPEVMTNRQILMSKRNASTGSSIPDTSSLTSDETLDSRKTSAADIESNEGSSTAVEYVDAPVPKVNPWVANRNAASVITGSGPLPGFPSVAETLTQEPPQPKPEPRKEKPVEPKPPVVNTPVTPAVVAPQVPPAAAVSPTNLELPKKSPPQVVETQSVYIRESNGVRFGRGRGSCSAAKNPSRRSVVVLKVVGAEKGPEDWPTLGEAVSRKQSSSADEDEPELNKSAEKPKSPVPVEAIKTEEPKAESPEPPPPGKGRAESSSSDNDEDGGRGSRKGSKQKWVPLDMSQQQQERRRKSKPRNYSNYHYQSYHKPKGKENMGGEYAEYGRYSHHRPPRAASRQGPPPPLPPPQQQMQRSRRHPPHHHRSNSTLSLNNHVLNGGHRFDMTSPTGPAPADFQDFPPDFSTLTPMYPAVSDFIMPYVANGYFPTLMTPPAGVIVEPEVVGAAPLVVQSPVNNDLTLELVRTQMEYYFSEDNLTKDFYLRRKMTREGFLPIAMLATFPRVTQLTQDLGTVVQSIQSSAVLELNPQQTSVRTRLNPEKWPIYETLPDKCINNNNPPGETLNPNVPEFVPKSRIAV